MHLCTICYQTVVPIYILHTTNRLHTTRDMQFELCVGVSLRGSLVYRLQVKIAPELLQGIASVFATTQTSVLSESASMLARLGRPNYVTPTNYLELVKGYCKLLHEKRASVGDQAFKLKNGLQKLSDTAEQV